MDINTNCINTVRILSAETVQKAKSGHPGAPMGCAPMAHALWSSAMTYAPSTPDWPNRDRFVLSNGHGCALLYVMLHLTGYKRPTLDDLKSFRQLNSVTAGHPENHLLAGVEVSTGPLGQGISNAVGMAIGEAHLAARYNREGFPLIDHYTFVICGDGCLQEGVAAEACSLAGHLGLGKLIVLYDDNDIQIDGSTSLAFTEDVGKRFEAYGWQVLSCADGNSTDTNVLEGLISQAKATTDKPTIIKVKTTIGIYAAKAGTHKVHGSPLGDEDVAAVKSKLGFDPNSPFHVPDAVRQFYSEKASAGELVLQKWQALLDSYGSKYSSEAAELKRRWAGDIPENLSTVLPRYNVGDKTLATRKYSQLAIAAFADLMPEWVGGSADLTPSNLTDWSGAVDFQKSTPEGRYLRFGVREHGMCAIVNGLAAYGGFIPFGATFLNFVGYALGAIRVSALSHFRTIYVMTHDSIGLGEDGPTHQPVETLVSLRGMPNHFVFRPCDGNETSGSYLAAFSEKFSPSTICLSRQGLPILAGTSLEKVQFGGYILSEAASGTPELTFVATGSEVSLCVEAAKLLDGTNVRIVSMPCWELFEAQSDDYKKSVLATGCPVISVEAGSVTGWSRYSHYQIGMTTFGVSAPGKEAFRHFGFTADQVETVAKKVLTFYAANPVPPLLQTIV
jgi:transketolase